jgi:hypothetical protein
VDGADPFGKSSYNVTSDYTASRTSECAVTREVYLESALALPRTGLSARNSFRVARQPSMMAFNREEIGCSRALPAAAAQPAEGPI